MYLFAEVIEFDVQPDKFIQHVEEWLADLRSGRQPDQNDLEEVIPAKLYRQDDAAPRHGSYIEKGRPA
jgi:hypothetical protein